MRCKPSVVSGAPGRERQLMKLPESCPSSRSLSCRRPHSETLRNSHSRTGAAADGRPLYARSHRNVEPSRCNVSAGPSVHSRNAAIFPSRMVNACAPFACPALAQSASPNLQRPQRRHQLLALAVLRLLRGERRYAGASARPTARTSRPSTTRMSALSAPPASAASSIR